MPWLKETRRPFPGADGLIHMTEIIEFDSVGRLPRFSRRYHCHPGRIVGSADFVDGIDEDLFAGLGDLGPVTCFGCLAQGDER